MHPKLKKTLQYGLFLGLGIFLTVWQYNKMTVIEKQSFVASIKSANYIYIFPIVIMAILSHFSRAIRWRYLIKPLGYNPTLAGSFATVMIGYLVNTLKCTLLGRKEKIPVDKLIGTILVERAIDLGCYVVLILITIALQYNIIGNFVVEMYDKAIRESNIHPVLKLGIIIVMLVIIFFIFKTLYKRFKKNSFFKKINSALEGVKDGFQSIKKLQRKKEFWFHTFFIWLMYLLQIYIGFKAMSFTSHLGIDVACAILTMGTLAMILTPGGMGTFPLAVAEVLLLFKIAIENGTAFGWVIWGVSTTIIIVTGIICTIWFEYLKRKQHEIERIQST
jgi:glycosyltransferase 2 family protein